MAALRTHFTFCVDTWTPDGESIVDHVAGIEDYRVALATYRAACQRWPGTPITLRQGARVIEDSRRLRVGVNVSIPRTDTAVIRHFQQRMPYGLFVPDVP